MSVNTEHLADLIVGFARAQRAVVQALVKTDGQANMAVIGALQAEAGVSPSRPGTQPTLADLPARVLLQIVGGHSVPPQVQTWLKGELDRLTG